MNCHNTAHQVKYRSPKPITLDCKKKKDKWKMKKKKPIWKPNTEKRGKVLEKKRKAY